MVQVLIWQFPVGAQKEGASSRLSCLLVLGPWQLDSPAQWQRKASSFLEPV